MSLLDRACNFLQHNNMNVFRPSLEFIGQVLSLPSTAYAERLLEVDFLKKILGIMINEKSGVILKTACWAISNFSATSVKLKMAFIDSFCFARIMALADSANSDVRSEALWALVNTLSKDDSEQVDSEAHSIVIEKMLAEQEGVLIARFVRGLEDSKDGELKSHILFNLNRLVTNYPAKLAMFTDQLENLTKISPDTLLIEDQKIMHNLLEFVDKYEDSCKD